MKLNSISHAWMRLSSLALISLLAAFVVACTCNTSKKSETPAPAEETEVQEAPETPAEALEAPEDGSISYQEIEQKPTFNGADANAFSQWVNSQLEYPESAREAGTEGRVLVQFTVNTDGTMGNVKVLRSVSPELDAEVLRVIESCTEKWTPGMKDGKPVPVYYTFPVVFKLQ